MCSDLFISYSRRDNEQGCITELVANIKRDFASFEEMQGRELRVFLDQDEIHGMSDWRQRILQGLRESRLLLACLSPAYLQSEYCEWEFVEYLQYEIGHLYGFNGVAPIYEFCTCAVQGLADKNVGAPLWLRLRWSVALPAPFFGKIRFIFYRHFLPATRLGQGQLRISGFVIHSSFVIRHSSFPPVFPSLYL